MQIPSISPTEGYLVIEMPGRGVSLIRSGKSRPKGERSTKCGHRIGKTKFTVTATNVTEEPPEHTDHRPTVMRVGGEITREIELRQSVCHQQCRISQETAKHWAITPRRDEYTYGPRGKTLTPKYNQAQRFAIALTEHFECICIAANIRPDRCTWKFESI